MKGSVYFVSYRLGYDSLLYWDPILSNLKKEFKELRVFTAWPSLKSNDGSVQTEYKIKGFKYYFRKNKLNQRLLFIPLPFFVRHIKNPELLILNEFNLANFYLLLKNNFFWKSKVLLLVESDPFKGYSCQDSVFRKYYRMFFVSFVDKILTNNKIGADYLINNFKVNVENIFIKPFLVSSFNHGFANRSNFKINSEIKKVSFLFVGRIIEAKGIFNLFSVLNDLIITNSLNLDFHFVGDGPLLSWLEERVKSNGLGHSIFVHGKLPYSELGEFYFNADCFILPTFTDYRSLVSFEALSAGCFLLVSKFDGARFEVVDEGKNGFIFDPYDVNDIKEKILKFISIYQSNNSVYREYSLSKSELFTYQSASNNLIEACNLTMK